MGYAQLDDLAFARNAFTVQNVENRFAERRRNLVFNYFDAGFVANHLIALLDGADAADIQAHRGIELERIAAGRRFRVAEHDADLHANLVDEDNQRIGAINVRRQLAQGLTHQTGVQARQRIPHIPLNFRFGHQRRHRVDDHDVDTARTHQHIGDFERLLSGIRLRDEQIVELDAQLLRIHRIERMLGVDESRRPAEFLHLGDDLKRQRCLAGRFRTVNLDDPPARQAADTQRNVKTERAGRNHLQILFDAALAHFHDRAFAELPFDLGQRRG